MLLLTINSIVMFHVEILLYKEFHSNIELILEKFG